jgi:hypothetical protein
MKYVLLMQFATAGWKERNMGTWPREDIRKNIEFLNRFHKDLAEEGELVSHNGLGGPEGMKIVRATASGAPAITDGPFPEAKEFLAGFWIVDVESPKRALEIAGRLSSLPGPGGGPANLPIEVRPVMEGMRGDL